MTYFFSIAEFSEEKYHAIHIYFIVATIAAFLSAVIGKIPSVFISVSIIYISYLIINQSRYIYGEDYIFSSGYNIWTILTIPNLCFAYLFFSKKHRHKYWSWFYIFLLLETAVIERLLSQSLDADSYYFYRHIGMLNYPAFYTSCLCILILFISQALKGKILNAATLFTSISILTGMYFSENLFAFSLFFLAGAFIELVSSLYYVYYSLYKNEELDIANIQSYYREAEKKYPLKYSVALMYMDDYERLIKRFGANKMLTLKKMFLSRIRQINSDVLIYNYKDDALVLTFMNKNASESFEKAEEIRRILAKSIFIFNENNHLQLTVSQCVSEKKRSDSDAAAVLYRAEENLQKACKFTRNITVKA